MMTSRNGSIPDDCVPPTVLEWRLAQVEAKAEATEAEQRSTSKELAVLTGQIKVAMWLVPIVCTVLASVIQFAIKLIH